MTHRLTIDYAEDYELIRRVYDALYVEEASLRAPGHPRLPGGPSRIFALNHKFAGVNWYRHHLGELKTVDASHPDSRARAQGA
jgi:spore coat polysaccharide biosynthesis protein SpsF